MSALHLARSWDLRHPGRHAALSACALCCAPAMAAAQAGNGALEISAAPETFVHESWTVEDGLPVNSINALLQSRDGYLWIATFDGLVRFDGVRFTVFNAANSPGLPSNRIVQLHEAADGALWLRTTPNQLVRLRAGVFTHFGPERGVADRVWTLYENTDGTVWVGTERGLGFIRDERLVPVAPETIRGQVRSIVQRRDGSLWAGLATGGLFRIEGGEAARVAAGSMLAAEGITALYEDPGGTLWIGTEAGVWRFRDRPERLLPAGGVLEFRASPGTGEVWLLTASKVFRIGATGPVHVLDRAAPYWGPGLLLPDEAGRMLYSSGLDLHGEGRRIAALLPDAAAGHGALVLITAIAQDHEGSLWLGTSGAGLHRLKAAAFTTLSEREGLHRNVYSVYEDDAAALWVGTLQGGTYRLAGERVTRMSEAQGYPVTVSSFLQDRAGRLWLGGGVPFGLRVCPRPGARCAPPTPNPINRAQVLAIHQEPGGALWFGTGDGLFRLHDGEWSRFGAAEGATTFPIRAFQQTRDGALWMGTNGGGLVRYHRRRFRHLTTADGLPGDLIRSLHEDGDGWLWVGTEGRGLVRLDPREWAEGHSGGRVVHYRTQDGLADEVIHQILEDDFGRLWMSSNRGIFWVRRLELLDFADALIARIHSTMYTERDGLRNREANGGSQPAGIRSRDGRLWFPTQDGMAVVDPARIQQNPVAPPVVIEQVMASGVVFPVRPGSGLELGVQQRDLEIDYTALSLLAPANVRFRYRLEGYDEGWVEAGSRRTAYYTRVPPGRYTFRVVASNNDGVWNEQGAALELQLAPQFRETGAFRLLALLLAGLLLAGGVGWRVRSLRARTRELARLVEERTIELRQREAQLAAQNAQLEGQADQLQELDRARSHFFANVSHEFRTPLTLILGPLEDLAQQRDAPPPKVLRRQIAMMTRNAQRLQRLVNQVLDLAKLESRALTLAAEPHDLVELTRAVTHSFTPLAEQRRIALTFDSEPERLVAGVDAEQIEKVLLNLLSNALKFTEPGGRVEVRLGREDGSAVVTVRDTGFGIAPEQLPQVFQRFYQADSSATRRHEGTGIGLSLVRELVELHGGSVGAESQPGVGSTFVVRLPLVLQERGKREEGRKIGSETAENGEHESVFHTDSAVSRSAEGGPRGIPAEPADEPDTEDRTTVLVVDDHADIRAYVRSLLEPAFRVLEAADGEEGLERAREALPDLVVADVMMPKLDGFGLVHALREEPLTDCIPVILLTARAAPGHEVEGLGVGADDYVAKPFHAAVLRARVDALIASRRRLRERFREEGLPAPAVAVLPAPVRSQLEERLRALIEANLTEPDFNPEALAAAAGLSYQQLYRRLRDELGASPSLFVRRVRVERAAELLREDAGSITEVAYSVGFNSLSYFYRCFHERFGLAPSEALKPPA